MVKGTLEIFQRQYAVSHRDDDYNALATFGCDPCVAIAGYNNQNGVGFLMHVDAPTDINLTLRIISNLVGDRFKPLDFEMYYRSQNSESLEQAVSETPSEHNGNTFRIASADTKSSLILYLTNGFVGDYIAPKRKCTELDSLADEVRLRSYIGQSGKVAADNIYFSLPNGVKFESGLGGSGFTLHKPKNKTLTSTLREPKSKTQNRIEQIMDEIIDEMVDKERLRNPNRIGFGSSVHTLHEPKSKTPYRTEQIMDEMVDEERLRELLKENSNMTFGSRLETMYILEGYILKGKKIYKV